MKGAIANCIPMARLEDFMTETDFMRQLEDRFTHLSAGNRILHNAEQKWLIQCVECEECGAMESDSLDVQLEHCKRCNKVICEECFAANCSAGAELRSTRMDFVATDPNPFTWVHRNYFLNSELPSLFLQQRNLCTPNRSIEDDSDSWSSGMSAEDVSSSGMSAEDDSRSGMSAEDGSQGDADTQELRTEVILGTFRRFPTDWTATPEMQARWYRS